MFNIKWSFFPIHTAVHCNLSQNGIDHQMCPEDMTSQLEEDEEFVDGGAVLLDDGGPSFRDVSPPVYQRRSLPQRSVSESELTRVRAWHTAGLGEVWMVNCSSGFFFSCRSS